MQLQPNALIGNMNHLFVYMYANQSSESLVRRLKYDYYLYIYLGFSHGRLKSRQLKYANYNYLLSHICFKFGFQMAVEQREGSDF